VDRKGKKEDDTGVRDENKSVATRPVGGSATTDPKYVESENIGSPNTTQKEEREEREKRVKKSGETEW